MKSDRILLAAQDIYAEMVPSFWEDAEAVILVYDVTRAHTLEACANWYGRLLQTLGKDSLPGVLVANKTDLRERLVVKRAEGQQLASQLGLQVPRVAGLVLGSSSTATIITLTCTTLLGSPLNPPLPISSLHSLRCAQLFETSAMDGQDVDMPFQVLRIQDTAPRNSRCSLPRSLPTRGPSRGPTHLRHDHSQLPGSCQRSLTVAGLLWRQALAKVIHQGPILDME